MHKAESGLKMRRMEFSWTLRLKRMTNSRPEDETKF